MPSNVRVYRGKSKQVLVASRLCKAAEGTVGIMFLLDLPDEILLKILGHLTIRDLHLTLSRVCKRLLVLTRDPGVIKHLAIYKKTDPADKIGFQNPGAVTEPLLQRHASVKSIDLEVHNVSQCQALIHCKSLTALKLVRPDRILCQEEFLLNTPDVVLANIEELTLDITLFARRSPYESTIQRLKLATNLTTLVIATVPAQLFNEILKIHGKKLKRLEVNWVNVWLENIDIDALEACQRLTVLRLSSVDGLMSVIERMKSLKKVTIRYDNPRRPPMKVMLDLSQHKHSPYSIDLTSNWPSWNRVIK